MNSAVIPTSTNNKPIVLYVEDDELIAMMLADLLEDQIGEARFVTVSSLETMREYLKNNHNIVMAIIDGNFPEEKKWMISFQWPAAIKLAQNANIPTIFAYSTEEDKFNALPEWDCPDAFFCKPWAIQSLVASIVNRLSLLEEETELA
jgi:DNA-binding response OmpR family regulator